MKDASGFQYFLTDHLGSTSVVLSTAGAILEQQRYMPFGQARTDAPYANVTSTDFTYTGQRALPNTGLMDYKARFYSPSLGRFIQPDTIVPSTDNPQSWNRFSYVNNSPIRSNDPTGHMQAESNSNRGDNCSGKLSKYCVNGKPLPRDVLQLRSQKDHPAGCVGMVRSVVCKDKFELPNDYTGINFQTTSNSDSSDISSDIDEMMFTVEYGKEALDLMDLIEDGILLGKPVYKQIKYAVSLGGFEYGIDAGLQLYEDRDLNLTPYQRFMRASIRGAESFFVDAVGSGMGVLTGAAFQVNVPVPVVSAGVGFVVGSYTTSTIIDSRIQRKNSEIFAFFGVGAP